MSEEPETAETPIASIIIPAFNEERHLPNVLAALKANLARLNYEVIVVDNGSIDQTPDIARANGVQVLSEPNATIGGLRNIGATKARGKYFVFLDADVVITRSWEAEFARTTSNMVSDDRIITGSRYGVRANASWIERNWFEPMTREKANYINAGHLVIRRDVFAQLGGFDEKLRTAEDYDLCMRAKSQGIRILNNPALAVVHEGYPRTVKEFIRRERWHGIQDFADVRSVLASWPAKATLAYWSAWMPALFFAIALGAPQWLAVGAAAATIICIAATLRKRRQFRLGIPQFVMIYHLYFFARGLSLIDSILNRDSRSKRNVL